MTTIDKLKQIISEYADIDINRIKPEKSFVNDFAFDSLETAELFMLFEREFGIEIPDIMSRSIALDELARYIDSAIIRKQVKNKHFSLFSKKKSPNGK